MRIILLQDIRGIGAKYDVKDAKDGYARNFLFPNNLAKAATPSELKKLEEMKVKMNKEEQELKKHLEQLVEKIKNTALEFKLKTDGAGSVFGSVTKEQILRGMRDAGLVTKERAEIRLDRPIKEIGEHKIAVNLKKGIVAELNVVVRAE